MATVIDVTVSNGEDIAFPIPQPDGSLRYPVAGEKVVFFPWGPVIMTDAAFVANFVTNTGE